MFLAIIKYESDEHPHLKKLKDNAEIIQLLNV
jgi:hypothetical protein